MRVAVAAIAAIVALCACSGSITSSTEMVFDAPPAVDEGDPVDTIDASFTQVQARIITPSCALSGCHLNSSFPRLSSTDAYDNLVGIGASSGQSLIDPGSPSSSYMFLKVTNDASIGGSAMPRGAPPLSDELVSLLRTWIERGALDD